ncbi:MAG: metallophosphoesterase [Clostridiales bacterium]|nr:metallophosphoesterase [Clostridiales bacterium]
MTKFLGVFRRALAAFLSLYFVLFTARMKPDTIEPLDRDNLKMELALIADAHTEGNNKTRFDVNSTCFKNLKGGKDTIDALILLGDNTMNGQAGEYLFFYGMMEHVNPIKQYYPIVGNHDLDNDDPKIREKKAARTLQYLQTFVDDKIDDLYYSETVKGYRLIFLSAPQTDESSGRRLSENELDWFEDELDEAAKTGLPIFVFNHFPYYYMDDTCYDRYIGLLNRYDDIFVVVGHMHYYMRAYTIPGEKRTPEIWVPCVTMLGDDNEPVDETGRGYLLEVYPDRVEVRSYNYYRQEFLDFTRTYPLAAAR